MPRHHLAPALDRLVREISTFPGIGRRAAERIALDLASRSADEIRRLAEVLVESHGNLRNCSVCGNLADVDPCGVCSASDRDHGTVCVVEGPREVGVLERLGSYRGVYHVLGGLLAPLAGIGRDDLRVDSLLERVKDGRVKEVILVLSPSLEGDTTALLVEQELVESGVRVTRAARGIPSGGDLDFLDEVTLGSALEGRRETPST